MKQNDEMRRGSYRDREMRSRRRRERELRKTKMILINAAIALGVILIVFVVAIIKLNGKNNSGIKNYSDKNVSQKSSEKNKGKKDTAKKSKPTAAPTATVKEDNSMGGGSKKWIRKNLDKNKPMIALTFDDGPYTPVTSKILRVLKKYDSRATFFVVGNRVNTYSKVLKASYNM